MMIRPHGYLLPAFVLFYAAFSKAFSFFFLPGNSYYFLVFATFDAVLAIWLCCGRFALWAKNVSILVFFFFIVYLLTKVFDESARCFCFGSNSPNPRFMLAVDFGCLFSLLLWNGESPGKVKRWTPLAVAMTISVAIFVYQISAQKVAFSENSNILNTASWVGKRLDEIEAIQFPPESKSGLWRIVFFQNRCPKCKRNLEQVKKYDKVLVLEMAPFEEQESIQKRVAIWMRLDANTDWIADTSKIVLVEDGVVVEVE